MPETKATTVPRIHKNHFFKGHHYLPIKTFFDKQGITRKKAADMTLFT